VSVWRRFVDWYLGGDPKLGYPYGGAGGKKYHWANGMFPLPGERRRDQEFSAKLESGYAQIQASRDEFNAHADLVESEMARWVERFELLAAKWVGEAEDYPPTEGGLFAATAVRMCARELRDELAR
jgi:hypothetical protein